MMINEIKKFLQNYKIRGVKSALVKQDEYMVYIEQHFPGIPVNEVIYRILHDVQSTPMSSCGNPAKFENIGLGYSEYCSLPKFGKDKCVHCYAKLQDKKKVTNLEKYGTENPAQSSEVKQKMAQTNIERYGDARPSRTDVVKKKCIETSLKRYGVTHASQLKENQERRKNTVQEKYGVHNVLLLSKKNLSERYSDFGAKFDNTTFQLISTEDEYNSLTSKGILHWLCKECNNTFYKVASCVRCPTCNPYSSSTAEVELYSFVQSLLPDDVVIRNTRSVIKGKELDIFIPSKNVGIEFNGEYWHREEVRSQNYHQEKSTQLRLTGGRLITVYASDWQNRREMIEERIRNVLGLSTVVYARKCKVRVLKSSTEHDAFLSKWHIQGTCVSSIKLGLYLGDELYAVMTFGKPRFNKKYQYELIRYCSKGTVVGGAGKLLKYFERTYNPKSLVTYADMNWSTGNLYQTLGMAYTGDTKPGYFYYDRKSETILSRWQCQKHKLIEKYGFGQDMTESEMTKELGYFKIWDSGNMMFEKIYS